MICAASCYQTVGSVFDPLVAVNEDGEAVAVPRGVDHAQRRLHRVDDQGALRRDVPRRHAVRRGRDRGQHHPPDEVVPHRQGACPTSRRIPTARPQIVVTDPMTVHDHDEAIVGRRSLSTSQGSSASSPARRGWRPPTPTRRSSRSRSAPVRSSSRTTSRASRSPRRRTRTTGTSPTRTSTSTRPASSPTR